MTDHGLPLPHMGWNRVYAKAGDRLFRGIEEGAYFLRAQLRHAGRVHHRPVQLRRGVHRRGAER